MLITPKDITEFISKIEKNMNSTEEPTKPSYALESSAHLSNKNVLEATSLIQEYVKANEEYKVYSKNKLQSLEKENKKINEENEKINDLINNPQKINSDTTNYIKLFNSHKELQENFNSLFSQKQEVEKQLEEKTKEIDSLSETVNNNAQLIETKDNDLKKLEEINSNLKEEASKYQSALGAATTYQLGDDDKNNSVRLNEDITRLQDMLEDYVTNLRPKIDINYKKVNNLFIRYQCDLEMTSRIKDFTLIKALLQRHTIEFIHEETTKYFGSKDVKEIGKPYLLESEIDSKVTELMNLTNKFVKTRFGSNIVTSAVPIKIRQQIFSVLSNQGFSEIIDDKEAKCEHDFINKLKKKLNQEMESYRKMVDPKRKKEVEEKAADIIREVVRLFFFRLKTQEPIAMWKWFDNNDKIDPIQMTGSWDEEEIEDSTVEICNFPLIYKDSDSSASKLQIYTPAKVFIRTSPSEEVEEEEEEKEVNTKSDTKRHSKMFKIPKMPKIPTLLKKGKGNRSK